MSQTPRARLIDLENPFAPLDGMCELLLIRHGEQDLRPNIPLGEVLDAPLSPLGRDQARVLGERLASAELHAIYASPLQRAHDTGRAIAAHHDHLEPRVIDDLREIDLWQKAPQDKGLLDVLSREELTDLYREIGRTKLFRSHPFSEDPDVWRARVLAAVDGIVARHQGERVAVVCHGGVIQSLLSACLHSTRDQILPLHHTSITTVRAADARRVVLGVNDFAHVHAVQGERGDINA